MNESFSITEDVRVASTPRPKTTTQPLTPPEPDEAPEVKPEVIQAVDKKEASTHE
jgi:hypothetical protein